MPACQDKGESYRCGNDSRSAQETRDGGTESQESRACGDSSPNVGMTGFASRHRTPASSLAAAQTLASSATLFAAFRGRFSGQEFLQEEAEAAECDAEQISALSAPFCEVVLWNTNPHSSTLIRISEDQRRSVFLLFSCLSVFFVASAPICAHLCSICGRISKSQAPHLTCEANSFRPPTSSLTRQTCRGSDTPQCLTCATHPVSF